MTAGSTASPGGREVVAPIRCSIRFERFPVSLKGAFVLRGADGNPHAVQFGWARVERVPSGPAKDMAVEERQLEVAPSRDLFVPFEVGVSELDPGWYVIRCSIKVDAGRSHRFAGRLFSIPWPRGDIRRGTFAVDASVRAGSRSFVVDRLELTGDSATVCWRPVGGDGGDPESDDGVTAVLLAGGELLQPLPESPGLPPHRPRQPGERRTVFYPVPRAAAGVAVTVRLPSGEESKPLSVSLQS